MLYWLCWVGWPGDAGKDELGRLCWPGQAGWVCLYFFPGCCFVVVVVAVIFVVVVVVVGVLLLSLLLFLGVVRWFLDASFHVILFTHNCNLGEGYGHFWSPQPCNFAGLVLHFCTLGDHGTTQVHLGAQERKV